MLKIWMRKLTKVDQGEIADYYVYLI